MTVSGILRSAQNDITSDQLRPQRLIQIPENIFDIFQANGQTNEIGADACGELFFVGKLGVGCAGGMDGERFGVAEVGDVAEELQVVNEILRLPHVRL